jgi:hypothetical protein
MAKGTAEAKIYQQVGGHNRQCNVNNGNPSFDAGNRDGVDANGESWKGGPAEDAAAAALALAAYYCFMM